MNGKTGRTIGTGVKVLGGAEMGGGVVWGERLRIFLPFPLILLFLAAFAAEDMAAVEALSLLGLGAAASEEDGLMNGPHFLKIDCWQMSRAVCTLP